MLYFDGNYDVIPEKSNFKISSLTVYRKKNLNKILQHFENKCFKTNGLTPIFRNSSGFTVELFFCQARWK